MNSLIVMLSIMFLGGLGLVFFAWKFKYSAGGKFINIKNQQYVSSKEKFFVVQWNNKEFLCFAGPNTFEVIDNKKLVKNDIFEKVLAESCTV